MSDQDNRFASVTTPLGKDFLLFSRMHGTENISRLFEYEVDLLVDKKNLSSISSSGFPTDKILGEGITIEMALPSGGKRNYHGIVTQFRHYGAEDEFFYIKRY